MSVAAMGNPFAVALTVFVKTLLLGEVTVPVITTVNVLPGDKENPLHVTLLPLRIQPTLGTCETTPSVKLKLGVSVRSTPVPNDGPVLVSMTVYDSIWGTSSEPTRLLVLF